MTYDLILVLVKLCLAILATSIAVYVIIAIGSCGLIYLQMTVHYIEKGITAVFDFFEEKHTQTAKEFRAEREIKKFEKEYDELFDENGNERKK